MEKVTLVLVLATLFTVIHGRDLPEAALSMVTESLQLPDDFSVLGDGPHVQQFADYVAKHGKAYSTKRELLQRFQNFQQSVSMVKAANEAKLPYTLELNKFADWSWEEFKQSMLGSPQNCSATKGTHVLTSKSVPDKVDWREAGIVGPIKNQRHCGSCWTFSTTGALESAVAQATGNIVSLSEQQLVDCAGKFNNFGCSGGLPSQAFEYVMFNGGLDTEEAYPYHGVDQACQFNANKVAARVKDVVNITEYNEDELIDAVAFVRPVSIAYQVASDFRLYKSGVYTSTVCESAPESLNHAVVAVGFDRVSLPLPHYIVRNSWGEDWGEEGYFKIELGKNMCGVATCASYPVV